MSRPVNLTSECERPLKPMPEICDHRRRCTVGEFGGSALVDTHDIAPRPILDPAVDVKGHIGEVGMPARFIVATGSGGLWRVIDTWSGRTATKDNVTLDMMKHRAAEQQAEMMNLGPKAWDEQHDSSQLPNDSA